MMTSARPIAMSKSRVQTRISLRSVFAEDAAPLAAPADAFAKSGEDRRESGFSGEVTEPRCFWSERSEEHTSELQSRFDLVCRLLLEKKKRIVYRDQSELNQLRIPLGSGCHVYVIQAIVRVVRVPPTGDDLRECHSNLHINPRTYCLH